MSAKPHRSSLMRRLTLGTALALLSIGLAGKSAADPLAPEGAWDSSAIVPNNNLNRNLPPPGGILDTTGIIGIGQMVSDVPPAGGSVGLCTGSLINPRTVIFAAHCVNTAAASAYGSAQGGIALSFGFNSDNRPAAINWINNNWQTNKALAIYNANQVWYDPRSLALGPSLNFLQADVAIATLDTRADDIPTWTLLFSPLTEKTHVSIVGYGATGNATQGAVNGIDFRRRAAENMLDSLASLADRNAFLFGNPGTLTQTLYSLDFDDPLRGQPGASPFDFDLFDGAALPRESITAGGDSGGPLIVDQKFDKPVVAGVLSGGSRFFGAQPFSSYGTQSFYQPLFMFWDVIVQNNPYAYVSAKEGNGDWYDPTHWVQDMDPNYAVVRNGVLANDLPDTPALGVSGDTVKFGTVCFLDDCTETVQAGPGANSTGPGLILPGGPGSTNFTPNNVEPDRLTGIKARYYDVNLSRKGETRLREATATVDKLSLTNGRARLRIDDDGVLNVVGDFTLSAGEARVDGVLNTGEALIVQGILTGKGTLNPTFLTNVAGAIAPYGDDVGRLSILGDVILSSGSHLFMEVGRNGADQLRILADPAQGTSGVIDVGGDLRLVKAANSAAPRHGQTFKLVLADGAVTSTFDRVFAQTGVLRPEVTYTPTSVDITLRAGKFADVIEGSAQELAFANALDRLRDGSYGLLADLYDRVDTLDFASMNRSFATLAPSALINNRGLMALQAQGATDTFEMRLAGLSRGISPGGITVMGAPQQVFALSGDAGLGAISPLQQRRGPSTTQDVLPEGYSMFVSGGYDESGASPFAGRLTGASADGLRSWNMSGGIERTMGDVSIGVAAAFARGDARESAAGSLAETSLAQAAAYGVRRFEGGTYVSGLVGFGAVRTDVERSFISGADAARLEGATDGQVVQALAEIGHRFAFGDAGLTPKLQVRRTTIDVAAFAEQGGPAALAFDGSTLELAEARLGLAFDADTVVRGEWRITPTIELAAVRNLAGEQSGVWTRFADAPDFRFLIPGEAQDDLWGEVTGGLRVTRGDLSLGFNVDSSVGRSDAHENRFWFDVGIKY